MPYSNSPLTLDEAKFLESNPIIMPTQTWKSLYRQWLKERVREFSLFWDRDPEDIRWYLHEEGLE